MAEALDNGGGAIGAVAPYLGLMGPVGAVAGAAASLAFEVSELANLKTRVQALLADFEKSDAGPSKIGEEWLEQGALAGPGFKEAEFLFGTYNVVREELRTFCKVLGLQMESMQIAIDLSKNGYQDIDDDIRARMQRLNAQITELQNQGKGHGGANAQTTMGGTSDAPLPDGAPSAGGASGTQAGF
ncbi:hypothetical protein ACIGO8_16590 [Streptomyces sp. NPDC053493]|uniref:hypothetical protein n=1 Tax=Streptomyces sp. NPDC053493 TaxID=3365705 RepID=UPI0037D6BFAC